MAEYDVGVIGAGIAGAAVAYSAARRGLSVVLLDREDTFSSHRTGRSAASLDPTIGGPVVQSLTEASLPFLMDDDARFGDTAGPSNWRPGQNGGTTRSDGYSMLHHRPVLLIAGAATAAELRELAQSVLPKWPESQMLTGSEAAVQCPALRPEPIASALWLPDASDIDTQRLFERFLAGARLAGAETRRRFDVKAIKRQGSNWALHGPERVTVRLVVNAAGAWADDIAALAGVEALGLRPLRRTVFTVAGTEGCDAWPLVADISESFYMKPWGASQLLLSPADETLDEPGNAKPHELDIARCIETVNAATTLQIRNVRSTWAGHRTFAADRVPVVGFDSVVDGFFWCAALGGTGIQNSPAISEVAGALLAGEQLPAELASVVAPMSPRRLRTAPGEAGSVR